MQIGFESLGVHDTMDGKYSKLYLPSTLISIPFGGFHPYEAKAFFLEKPDDRFFEQGQGIVYVSVDLYNELKDKDINHYLCPGNVTYIVDGKIYWFDDTSRFITAPQEPVKAGYKFAGWYKEQECINEWDFDNDRVPEIHTEKIEELGQNGYSGEPINILNSIYYYNETRLYAKWIQE